MKTNILLAVLASLAAGTAFAQSPIPSEADLSSGRWEHDALLLDIPRGSKLHLLAARYQFDTCGVDENQAGGIAILIEGELRQYGCWLALQKESDNSTWLKIKINDATEILRPLSAFKKRTSMNSSEEFNKIEFDRFGRLSVGHIRDTNHLIRMTSTLSPTFTEQQKAAAAKCIQLASGQLEHALTLAGILDREHNDLKIKWGHQLTLTRSENDAFLGDWRVIVDLAKTVESRSRTIPSSLQQCLKSSSIPAT